MVSDSTKTVVVIIAIAMALAATTPLIVGERADSISLRARDIGQGWQEIEHYSHDYTGNISYGSLIDYVVLSNETSMIFSQLFIFNSSEATFDHFPGLHRDPNVHLLGDNTVDIGDGGLLFIGNLYTTFSSAGEINGQPFQANGPNVAILMFMKGNVVSFITLAVKGIDTPAQSWINDFILELGHIQLQKIDRFSS